MLPLLARQEPHRLPVTRDREGDRHHAAVELLEGGDPLAGEHPLVPVRIGRLDRLAGLHGGGHVALEHQPGEGAEENPHAEVHDVAAVAPAVAPHQPGEREGVAFA
ncbi:MAG: hypothetical protein ACK55I_36075, partial [bacterium]